MQNIAVMQPYFFPYIGYFQLMHAADTFVFLDDVSYIKGGWINRNRILIHGKPAFFSIPCKNVSSNKYIADIRHDLDENKREKLLRKIQVSYSKAPFFPPVFGLVRDVIHSKADGIAELAVTSAQSVCDYLGIDTRVTISSALDYERATDKTMRLINICKTQNAATYINSAGGKALYDPVSFSNEGILLQFIEGRITPYRQFNSDFVPSLSIIDVLMFNSVPAVQKMLAEYTLNNTYG